MSMPGGYSTESLLPVSGSAASVPIVAMRGGDGSNIPASSSSVPAPIPIPVEDNSNWNNARERAGQQVTDLPNDRNNQTNQQGAPLNISASVTAPAPVPAPAPIPVENNSNWNNARELAGQSIQQNKPVNTQSVPPAPFVPSTPSVSAPSVPSTPSVPTPSTTPLSSAPSIKKQGLPIDIFNRTYVIRPSTERQSTSDFTPDEKEAIAVWRAEEVFPTREQQHEFLNELLLGCKNDTIIPTDSRCGRVRELLTNLASREWGAYHSTGTVRVGPRSIDRDTCEFMFDVTGACDMSKVLVRDDFIDFFDIDGGEDDIIDILNKPSYSYLDSATDEPGILPEAIRDITLGDIQRSLSSALSFHINHSVSSIATQRRIRAFNYIIANTLSEIGEIVKSDKDALHKYIIDPSAPIPTLFHSLSDEDKAKLRKKIDDLRSKFTGDNADADTIKHVMKAVDEKDADAILTKLDDITKKIDTTIQVSGAIQDATNNGRELTDEERAELDTFIRELEGEDPDDVAIRRVLGSKKALELWRQYVAGGMSPIAAFRTASVAAEAPNVPSSPILGLGPPTEQERATRELNEFLASYRNSNKNKPQPVTTDITQMANNSNMTRRNVATGETVLSDIPLQQDGQPLIAETPAVEQMANNSNMTRRNVATGETVLSDIPLQQEGQSLIPETPEMEQMANNSNMTRRNVVTGETVLSDIPTTETDINTTHICDRIHEANKKELSTDHTCDMIHEANKQELHKQEPNAQRRGEGNTGKHPLIQSLDDQLKMRTRTELVRYARDLGISSNNNDHQSLIEKIVKKIIVNVTGSSAADDITDNQRELFINKVNDILSIQLAPEENAQRNENIASAVIPSPTTENNNLEKILANTNTSIANTSATVAQTPSRRNIQKEAEITRIKEKIESILSSLEGQMNAEIVGRDKASIDSLLTTLRTFDMSHTNIGITRDDIDKYINDVESRLTHLLGTKAKIARNKFQSLKSKQGASARSVLFPPVHTRTTRRVGGTVKKTRKLRMRA